jgi:hypothetical protein
VDEARCASRGRELRLPFIDVAGVEFDPTAVAALSVELALRHTAYDSLRGGRAFIPWGSANVLQSTTCAS